MTHINNNLDDPKPKRKPHYKLPVIAIMAGVIVFGVLVFVFIMVYLFNPDKNPYLPTSIEVFDSSYISSEQRVADVSEWVKDVADNVKPSDERSTFADTVSNYTKDGEIDAGEYDALLRVYQIVKDKSYNDVITDSVTKIRMDKMVDLPFEVQPEPINDQQGSDYDDNDEGRAVIDEEQAN